MEKIAYNLTYKRKLLKTSSRGYYMTYVDGLVSNPHTGKKSLTTHKFIFDTGAAITILNRSFNFLFIDRRTGKKTTPVEDNVSIRYGSGTVTLPVYKIKLKIKGIEFSLLAAHDQNMELNSLLGHFDFLNELEHFGVSKKRKKLTIIK